MVALFIVVTIVFFLLLDFVRTRVTKSVPDNHIYWIDKDLVMCDGGSPVGEQKDSKTNLKG